MRGLRRRQTQRQKDNYARARRVQAESTADCKLPAPGPLMRGILDELVIPTGRNPLTVWILAWRCKRCGYVWPVRKKYRATGERAGTVMEPRPGSIGERPKKCPGCDSPRWWKDRLRRARPKTEAA